MNTDDQRRAAEALKDLIVEHKRSRWPLVLGISAVLAIAGGAAYWFYLPPEQRPALGVLQARLVSCFNSILNTPVAPASGAPKSASPQEPTASTNTEDSGLLSK